MLISMPKEPGERDILRTIRALSRRSAGNAIRVGIGDDCAVLTPRAGEELVITTDFSIQDRHFRLDWHPPEAIGHKALARGLSDVAAMGGRPVAAFVSLAVPKALAAGGRRDSWITRFYTGLLALADREHVTLAGGDLSESPTLAVADIIVIGAVAKGRALLRSTAKAGDILYITGTLGGAAAELATLETGAVTLPSKDQYAHPHFYPQPRIATGQALVRRRLATACIDISDGLSVDLMHLCEESHLDAELDAASIPAHAAATLEQALHGGDDYELLFTASPNTRIPKQNGGVAVHAIGRMLPAKRRMPNVMLITGSKATKVNPRGWEHF
jgi:thiamine-monophosphate kinase